MVEQLPFKQLIMVRFHVGALKFKKIMNKKRSVGYLMVILLFAALSGAFIYPKAWGDTIRPWKLGLDLVGGTQLIYEVDLKDIESGERNSVMSGLRDIVEQRVNLFGVSEPQVLTAKEGESDRLIVELAGIKDSSQAIAQIGRTALLEFREVVADGKDLKYAKTELTGRYLKSAQVVTDPNTRQPQIAINFDSTGAELFGKITGRNIGNPLAIFVDNALISKPVVQSKITGGNAVISGSFTFEEARDLANLLNAGALPAPMTLLNQETVSATLGAASLDKAIFAGAIGTLLVIIFMIGYYRSLGVFASLALMIYIAITLAVFKAVPITLTLSGIAGFILSIGMAVDANVLIFERTKEELRRGLQKMSALEEGFKRSWPSIRDSNITTIITSLILFYSTSSFVKGFAVSLLIGVLMSMFSAITVTRTLLRVFIKNK